METPSFADFERCTPRTMDPSPSLRNSGIRSVDIIGVVAVADYDCDSTEERIVVAHGDGSFIVAHLEAWQTSPHTSEWQVSSGTSAWHEVLTMAEVVAAVDMLCGEA